jgi:hypothetical protein
MNNYKNSFIQLKFRKVAYILVGKDVGVFDT